MVVGGTKLEYRKSQCSPPEYCYISWTALCDMIKHSLDSNNVSNAEVSNCVISCAPQAPSKNVSSEPPTTMCDICTEIGATKNKCVKQKCPNGINKCGIVSYTMQSSSLPKTKAVVKGCASVTECEIKLDEAREIVRGQRAQEFPDVVISDFEMKCSGDVSGDVVYKFQSFLLVLGVYLVVFFTRYH